jgi:hypothetical protein
MIFGLEPGGDPSAPPPLLIRFSLNNIENLNSQIIFGNRDDNAHGSPRSVWPHRG